MRVISAEITLARYRSRASRGGTMFPHVPPPASGGVKMRVISAEITGSLRSRRISRGNYVPPRAPSSLRRGRSRKNSTETEPNSKAKKAEAALDSDSCGWHKVFPRGAGLPCMLSWSVGGTRGRSPMAVFGTFWASKRYCPPRHEGQPSPLHGEYNKAAALPQKRSPPCAQQHPPPRHKGRTPPSA